MFARVTQFDIDTLALSVKAGVQRFEETIVPAVRTQPGYEGVILLHTPDGRGMLISLWADEASAVAGEQTGYYAEQIAKFVTFYRQPPGRDHFEVGFFELSPGVAPGQEANP